MKRVRVAVVLDETFIRMLHATVELGRLRYKEELTALHQLGLAVLLEARGAEAEQVQGTITHDWDGHLEILHEYRAVLEGDAGQGDVFSQPYGGTPPHVDAETSVEAAESIKDHAGNLRSLVLGYIARTPCTDDAVELALGLRHQTASARRRELVILKLVKDSGRKAKTRSGRNAIVWEAT